MSDFRNDIANIVRAEDIVREAKQIVVKTHYYPDIPEKIMKGIRKGISGDIGVNTVAAIFDYSFLENGKSALVFTVNGVFYKDAFVKKIYFNYKDVVDITYDGIYIKVNIGDKVYDISNVNFHEDKVIALISRLKAYVTEQGLESKKSSGVIKKEKLPKDLYNKCNVIIHGASVACGAVGAGLAQLPCADAVPITTAQVGMIVALGQVFGLNPLFTVQPVKRGFLCSKI